MDIDCICLKPGMKTTTKKGGILTVIDEDRLCYKVQSDYDNSKGVRTLSKQLILEFINYVKKNPKISSPSEVRDALKGTTDTDLFEYGYASTLLPLALLSIENEKKLGNTYSQNTELAAAIKENHGEYIPYIAAIRTKPFILLAGLSGTGKSRIVRELARACWPVNNTNRTAQVPENFSMIPVKPNWHDSSELIGYRSSYGGDHFVTGDFLRSIAKAWEKPTVPYFVCLDEMNLAPVEQYFAEYLSVIESRTAHSDGTIKTDPILRKTDTTWYSALTAELTSDEDLRKQFNTEGITIPPNLTVIGTVNMDETTYAFSRKVLDRAMTIEMNQVNLKAGLGEPASKLPDLCVPGFLNGKWLRAEDVYENGNDMEKESLQAVLEWLEQINSQLEGTPFKIAYRTRNEVIIYVIQSESLGKNRLTAFDEAVNMKILPRIEGDKNKVGDVLAKLKDFLEKLYSENGNNDKSASLDKLEEMSRKMGRQHYCTYWS